MQPVCSLMCIYLFHCFLLYGIYSLIHLYARILSWLYQIMYYLETTSFSSFFFRSYFCMFYYYRGKRSSKNVMSAQLFVLE